MNITGCVFRITYPHISSTVPGSVKVNATGNCPTSSETYTLEATMILEQCNDAGTYCYQYKTGTTTARTMTSTQSGIWYNQHLNAFTPCVTSANYRGRLKFRAWKADGTSVAVPLTEPVGYIKYVTCPA